MESKQIELTDFFSTTRQEEGEWFEPTLNGVGLGFEFQVTGTETIENEYAHELFNKDLVRINKIVDSHERVEALKNRMAKYVASHVKGIRGVGDNVLVLDGKPMEFSIDTVERLFYENFQIQDQVIQFARTTTNFMKRKK